MTDLSMFEQALLDRLDRLIAALAARPAAAPAPQTAISPATERALQYAGRIVPEPARPGEIGMVNIRGYKVRCRRVGCQASAKKERVKL